ncbi:hypothetical protein BDB00DRAFT_870250 [Zychaea mexicana]|uniref:uncharacterized protein n=1 Tax=Zychaea mexicana TaxID=64656 RepID=UPI0022FE82AD|nr:uncharacterized protein BDB00DRAFT_870250 [Zychaea mexicana]KAI9495708.1 hypothetical protein BDB00DRAFT_870250 [Zychaea mexicana]
MRVSWKVSLAALCTATLASFSSSGVSHAVPSHYTFDDHPILDILGRKLYQKRDIADIGEVCPVDSSSLAGAMFLHFTAIFFDDFTTGGGTDILAPNYIVNANRGQDCSVPPTTGLDGIGLVVGGLTATQDTRVHGDSVHAGGGNLEEIVELNEGEGCAIFDDIGTGAMDFEVAENAAIEASIILAASDPNMYIDANGVITNLGTGDSNYKIFTFNTCNDRDCNVPGVLSDPSAILLGEGNFNGPSGDVPSDDDTVVFNIPVTEGETIELKTNFPSQGFYACRTIYNFYPVNSQGIYSADSEITVFRNTGGQIEGFTLAPRAHIRDSTTGAFAGTIIGLDYAWYYGSVGVELHDYGAADDDCNIFAGCLPIRPTASYTTVTTVQTPTVTAGTITTTEVETTTRSYVGITSLPIEVTLPGSTITTDAPVTETTETTLTATTFTVVVPAPDPQTTTYETDVPQTQTETYTTLTTDGTSTYTITGTLTEVTEVPTTITSTLSETTVEYVSSLSSVVTQTIVETEETVITVPPTVSTSYSLTTEEQTSVYTYTTTETIVITSDGLPMTVTTVVPVTSWETDRPTRTPTTISPPTFTTTIYESTEVLGGTVYAYPYIEEKKKKGGWDDKKDGWGDKKGGWKDDKKGGWKDDKKGGWDDDKDDDEWDDDEWDDDDKEWDEDDKEWDDDKGWGGDSDWKKKGKNGKKYD